jgi:hypothetical protein
MALNSNPGPTKSDASIVIPICFIPVDRDKSMELDFEGHVTPAPWVNALANPFWNSCL